MQEVKAFLDKMVKNHWTPKYPTEYVVEFQGRTFGIGTMAMKDVAAFNLAWASVSCDLSSLANQITAVKNFEVIGPMLNREVEKYPMREWVCLMPPTEIIKWLDTGVKCDTSLKKIVYNSAIVADKHLRGVHAV